MRLLRRFILETELPPKKGNCNPTKMIPRNRSLSLPYQACLACSMTLTAYTFKNNGHKLQYSNSSSFFKASIETIANLYVYPSTEHVKAICLYTIAQVPISLLKTFTTSRGFLFKPTNLFGLFCYASN